MAEKQPRYPPNHPEPEPEVTDSLRSRASSVVSTGTRVSILTLPQSDTASQRNIDGILTNPAAAAAPRLVPRPMSIYSFRSMGEALPPYSETQILPTDGVEGLHSRPQTSQHLPNNSETRDDDDDNDDDNDDVHLRPNEAEAGEPLSVEEDNHSAHIPSLTSQDYDHDHHPDENALARHYGTIVRTIDETNARLITRLKDSHAQDLATLRNAIDAEYRKVLRQRSHEIERAREVAATRESELEAQISESRVQVEEAKREVERVRGDMEEESDGRCARARHLVEDLWEERWQRRNEVSAEEARRSEREWRETVRLLVGEERERWEGAVERVCGGKMLEGVRRAVREEEREGGAGGGGKVER